MNKNSLAIYVQLISSVILIYCFHYCSQYVILLYELGYCFDFLNLREVFLTSYDDFSDAFFKSTESNNGLKTGKGMLLT